MNTEVNINYKRIATAIEYIGQHFRQQPGLDEIAAQVHLSPAHFQRLFTEWAGTSPKKFLQYVSLEHAKRILKNNPTTTLFDATFDTGLSSTSRLHDLFVSIEGMTPAAYQNGGKNLLIRYSYADSPFGRILVASTTKGVCYMAFAEGDMQAYQALISKFPAASFEHQSDTLQQNALFIFQHDWSEPAEIKLHLKGTAFQLKVWETLLKIPMGQLTTYGNIARQLNIPNASRAVGTAIGSNPVAFLIPCHRVIQATGNIGGYMWGTVRKTAIIGWEGAKTQSEL